MHFRFAPCPLLLFIFSFVNHGILPYIKYFFYFLATHCYGTILTFRCLSPPDDNSSPGHSAAHGHFPVNPYKITLMVGVPTPTYPPAASQPLDIIRLQRPVIPPHLPQYHRLTPLYLVIASGYNKRVVVVTFLYLVLMPPHRRQITIGDLRLRKLLLEYLPYDIHERGFLILFALFQLFLQSLIMESLMAF